MAEEKDQRNPLREAIEDLNSRTKTLRSTGLTN